MAAEQKWVDKFDRIVGAENQLLGEPLEMPPPISVAKKDENGKTVVDEKGKTVIIKVNPLPDFFIRPPAGISPKAGTASGTVPALYPYSEGKASLRLQVSGTSDKDKKNQDFRTDVCRCAGITNMKFDEVKKETLASEPRKFHWTSEDIGAKHYAVYFVAQGDDQLAVVFEMPKGKAQDMDKVIDLCLGTLEVGPRAKQMGTTYKQKNLRGNYYRLRMQAGTAVPQTLQGPVPGVPPKGMAGDQRP
jgi:hypothetical protein